MSIWSEVHRQHRGLTVRLFISPIRIKLHLGRATCWRIIKALRRRLRVAATITNCPKVSHPRILEIATRTHSRCCIQRRFVHYQTFDDFTDRQMTACNWCRVNKMQICHDPRPDRNGFSRSEREACFVGAKIPIKVPELFQKSMSTSKGYLKTLRQIYVWSRFIETISRVANLEKE